MNRILLIIPALIVITVITSINIWSSDSSFMRYMSLSGFILTAVVMNLKKKQIGLSSIDAGIIAYTAFIAVIFWFFPSRLSAIVSVSPTGLLYLVLLGTTLYTSILRKRYFTEYFAEKTTPEAARNTDIYKNINRNMSRAWSVLFAASAIVSFVPLIASMPQGLLTMLLFQITLPLSLILGIGLPLNKRYPSYYQRKMGVAPVGTNDKIRQDELEAARLETSLKTDGGNMESRYKVVAINGSPHRSIGNTSKMIAMISAGLMHEGIEVEEIFLSDKNIEYCIGCGLCLEKNKCWRQDDHESITDKLLAADGIIIGSPVYFMHVTAQMKTFIDRSLSFGHKPRPRWKPGIAVCVSAGLADSETARYLEGILRSFGAFSVGTLTAIATSPGGFLGKDCLEKKAQDTVTVFASAIKEKSRYPATGDDLRFYLFMRDLVTREKDFMAGDYRHWHESGIMEGFESYMKQSFESPHYDPDVRKAWLRSVIKEEKSKEDKPQIDDTSRLQSGRQPAKTCFELIKNMPLGFHPEAAGGLSAVVQFEINGSEEFTAHLNIGNGKCSFHEGPAQKPDVVIKSPAHIWLSISEGNLDGQQAFLSGQYKIEGNLSVVMNFREIFG